MDIFNSLISNKNINRLHIIFPCENMFFYQTSVYKKISHKLHYLELLFTNSRIEYDLWPSIEKFLYVCLNLFYGLQKLKY